MDIRPLTAADAACFQKLRLEALAQDPVAFASSVEEEAPLTPAEVGARIEQQAHAGVYGAFDGDSLVGICGWGRDSHRKMAHKGYVWGLYVAPAARGTGAARQLMNAVLARAAQAGLKQLALTLYAGNTGARRLYESLGFVVYGHELDAICVAGVYYDDLHMALQLAPAPEVVA